MPPATRPRREPHEKVYDPEIALQVRVVRAIRGACRQFGIDQRGADGKPPQFALPWGGHDQ